MNEGSKINVQNPEEDANFFSRIFFWYLNAVFKKSYRTLLTMNDLSNPLYKDTSMKVTADLEKQWSKEILNSKLKKPSLLRAITRTVWKRFTVLLILPIVMEILKFLNAVILGELLYYFSGKWSIGMACTWAFLLSLCSIVVGIMHQNFQHLLQIEGMHIRTACSSLIYRKLMRVSAMTFSGVSSGRIVNIISSDVTRFDFVFMFLPYLIIAAPEIIAVIAFSWVKLGVYALLGFAFLFLLAALNPVLGFAFRFLRKVTALLTDRRVLFMSELLGAMQFIKMCSWEDSFNRSIKRIRKKEITKIWISRILECIPVALATPSTKIIIFLIITFRFVMTAQLPDTSSVYQVLTVLSFLRVTMLIMVPFAVRYTSESLIAIKRIQEFLLLEEFEPQEIEDDIEALANNEEEIHTENKHLTVESDESDKNSECSSDKFIGNAIEISNYYGTWDVNTDQFTLRNINMKVQSGNIVAIIGPVGSGKSSLLNAILKEITKVSGSLVCAGTVSYAPQVPWIFTASFRQNILFGSKYNRSRYLTVIKACALDKDLKEFPEGDRTILDDKGACLSGGQRARVGLARAIYKDADIYLLDDPLSAVDTQTSSYLFNKCFKGFLKGKTVILSTHHIQFLSAVNWTVVLKNGEVQNQGNFETLSHSGLNFSAYVASAENMQEKADVFSRNSSFRGSTVSRLSWQDNLLDSPFTVESLTKENLVVGDIKSDVYLQYFLAGTGIYLFLILLALFIIGIEALFILTDWWLSKWLSVYHSQVQNFEKLQSNNPKRIDFTYLGPFIGLTLGSFFGSVARCIVFISCIVNASRVLHNRMFHKILRAPMYFFTSNPVGIILNRFSKDIGIMDDVIPVMFQDALFNSLNVAGMLIYLAVVSPYTLISIVPLLIFMWFLRRIYLKCNQNVKRLEAITRTPLFSHLSATFQGLSSIRAFHLEKTVSDEFDEHLDFNNRAFSLCLSTQRWFQVRVECSCAVFIAVTSIIFIVLGSNFPTADIGLSLSYAVMMLGLVQWTMRQTSEIVSQMTSVERVLEYSKLMEEPPLISEVRPPANWPDEGKLTFEHVFFKYSPDSPYVLKDVSLVVNPGEKVGIVGRTGAGKSSFFNVILRMGEIEGEYVIDNIDVLTLGLRDLRTKISVIPQEPVFFTGTLRSNLDPFEEFQDFQIWDALEQVELKPFVSELENGLDTKLSEGGSNLSTGQRQLFCLARALLRKCRIMLVDEATANVDKATDAIIQQTIRRRFKDYTVITIAHRLDTIIDSDYVLVFSNGTLQEYDNPYILLSNVSSHFYRLASEVNSADMSNLLSLAKASWESKNN